MGSHPVHHPLNRGFDHFFGFLSGGHNYFPREYNLNDLSEVKRPYQWYSTKLFLDDKRVDVDADYLTDVLSDASVDFIKKCAKNDKPFFLFLAYNAPHNPLQATKKYLNRFDHIKNWGRKHYSAMVSAVDDGVGQVLDVLSECNIDENTLIFFLSDNGGASNNSSDNGILREHKGTLFEGGIRVPFAMQWPKEINGGQIFDSPIISLDIFATLKELTSPEIKSKNELHGVNLIPFLKGENNNDPHEFLFWRNNFMQNDPKLRIEGSAVRYGDFKFIKNKETDALYNLKKEISEQTNLKSEKNNIYDSLNIKFKKWSKNLMDPIFLGLIANDEYNKLNPDRFTY